jgi:Domain of unknown function (DUF4338)
MPTSLELYIFDDNFEPRCSGKSNIRKHLPIVEPGRRYEESLRLRANIRSSGLLRGNLHRSGPVRGTCYRAAYWQSLGLTTGRGKASKSKRPNRSIKEVPGYPLTPRFRELLSRS